MTWKQWSDLSYWGHTHQYWVLLGDRVLPYLKQASELLDMMFRAQFPSPAILCALLSLLSAQSFDCSLCWLLPSATLLALQEARRGEEVSGLGFGFSALEIP